MSEDSTTYVVTDVELDGPSPLRHSMLSFASVAINGRGDLIDTFEAVLTPRADRVSDPGTSAWWATEPEAYAEATRDPEPAEVVMPRYAAWVRGLPRLRVFAARPLTLDADWIDHYLDAFTGERVLALPRDEDPLFNGSGLDLASFAGALIGLEHIYSGGDGGAFPADWYGNVPHSHKAIDDARGYANVLSRLLEKARNRAAEGMAS
ncbi:DNA polymerase III subunit epsilon [Bauldia sp.]|uniref:DNA polymerase III subunit epsilon n=1 Tax=Bauldia sp. TaxID=2575872 RepID=UPI003BABBEDD